MVDLATWHQNILECCNMLQCKTLSISVIFSSFAKPSWVGLGDENNHHGAINHWNIHDGIPILQDFRKPIRCRGARPMWCYFQIATANIRWQDGIGSGFVLDRKLSCERKSCFFFWYLFKIQGTQHPAPQCIPMPPLYSQITGLTLLDSQGLMVVWWLLWRPANFPIFSKGFSLPH